MLLPLLLALVPQDPAVAPAAPAQPVESPQSAGPDWTRFRGAAGNGVLAERAFPMEWDADTNIAWSIDVPGSGWSSPVVLGERVYVTSAIDPEGGGPANMSSGVRDPSTMGRGEKPSRELTYQVSCFALADGELLWSKDVGKGVPAHGIHKSNTFATESPTTDGERLFVTFGALGQVLALDLEGEELWRQETGVFKTGNNFGWGISLVTHGGLVYLQNDNEEESFLVAFDAKSGEERWRAERGKGTSWGTPVVFEGEGRASLIATGPNAVVAYDPGSGEEQWRVTGFGGSFSSSATLDASHVYFGNSGPMSRGPLLKVPLASKGTIDVKNDEEPAIAWQQKRSGPGFASPVVHGGVVYILASSNVLACHDAMTGERLWRERVPESDQIVATPWVAGDELFILDESGVTTVLRAGKEFEVLRQNTLPGLYWSTPAVAGNSLLVREAAMLYCIRE